MKIINQIYERKRKEKKGGRKKREKKEVPRNNTWEGMFFD